MTYESDLDAIIEGLNIDLAWEYAAVIQYIQHAATLTGPEYFSIKDELEKHAEEEREHAAVISDLINYLGGTPTVYAAARHTSASMQEMLRQDLQGEYDAITRYLERIRQFEKLCLYDSAQKIRNIALVEQEHAIDLETALGIDRNRPAVPHLQRVYAENNNAR